MSVVVSMEDVGPCRKQLTVEVPADAVEAETRQVVREYGQKARVPGFRKGKVPAELVRRRFAKDIEREVVERLLPRFWRQAQEESKIDPLLPPEVDDVRDLKAGAPLTFVATVETRPPVELGNIRDFELPDPPIEPGLVDVDEAIEDLRARLAPWVAVERPAGRGDLVTAEITELKPGSPAAARAEGPQDAAPSAPSASSAPAPESPPAPEADASGNPAVAETRLAHAASGQTSATPEVPGTPDKVEVELGDPRVWEELSLALSGLAPGQETTFSHRDQPDEHSAHGHAGGVARERRFRVRALEVKERDLPPVDDAFAGRVGKEFKDVAAFREAVTERLRAVRREQRREQRQRALLDQLRSRHPLPLPQGVVQREVEHMVNDYAESLARRGVRLEQAGIDWQQEADKIRPHAERRVHDRLLLDAVADAESIRVEDEEFERALAALARAQGTTTSAVRRSLEDGARAASLRDQLRRDKTIGHLLGPSEGDQAAAAAATPVDLALRHEAAGAGSPGKTAETAPASGAPHATQSDTAAETAETDRRSGPSS